MKPNKILTLVAMFGLLLPTIASAQSLNAGATVQATGPAITIGGQANANAGVGAMAKKPHVRAYPGVVTAVSGNSITMTSGNSTYTVDASSAKIVRRFGAAMTVADVQVNDKLVVRGTLDGASISAKTIRDDSLQAKNGRFGGTVTSLNGTSGFVLQSKERGSQTVSVDSATKIKLNGKDAGFGDLSVGANVTVVGVWDRTNSNIKASMVNIVVKVKRLAFEGTISALGSNSLTVTAKNDGSSWSVDTTNAKFLRKFNGKSSLSEVKVGDSVQIRGAAGASANTAVAVWVKDLSITAKTVKGNASVNASANVNLGQGNGNSQ